jgi:hypothetical protein
MSARARSGDPTQKLDENMDIVFVAAYPMEPQTSGCGTRA